MSIAGIWFSNAAWAPTGYGTQTAQVLQRMNDAGHKVAVAANYGLEATTTEWEGITHFPRGFSAWSEEMVHPYWVDWKRQHADCTPHVFTLYDVWPLEHPTWDEMPVSSWVPIDHFPTPPMVARFLLKSNVHSLAMSKYGQEQLARIDIDSTYIPHAIDTNVYRPTDKVESGKGLLTGREVMGIPEDAYVVSIINANKGVPSRKAFPEQLLAARVLMESHDDVFLYIHAERSNAMGGIPFDTLLMSVGIPEDRIKFVNQYQLRMGIPVEAMAALYTATDVLLSPTYGEGFGITVIEAQACETPVIVNNFTAQPELVGDGWLTSGQPFWHAEQASWWNIPHVPSICEALEAAYQRGRQRSPKARQHIVDNYDADTVYRIMWAPYLASLEAGT